MNISALNLSPSQTRCVLFVLPVALFSAYIAWIIVPEIIRVVVPAVVDAVFDLFK